MSRNGVALAVLLDITNTFNVIPWDVIVEALELFEIPPTLSVSSGSI